ncbi:hypothetical protein HDU67_007462 [Dinochytrium kinnereticum]|nr:hypothetical protein HDU67_007462 [Dinochytrium kinnereticum]
MHNPTFTILLTGRILNPPITSAIPHRSFTCSSPRRRRGFDYKNPLYSSKPYLDPSLLHNKRRAQKPNDGSPAKPAKLASSGLGREPFQASHRNGSVRVGGRSDNRTVEGITTTPAVGKHSVKSGKGGTAPLASAYGEISGARKTVPTFLGRDFLGSGKGRAASLATAPRGISEEKTIPPTKPKSSEQTSKVTDAVQAPSSPSHSSGVIPEVEINKREKISTSPLSKQLNLLGMLKEDFYNHIEPIFDRGFRSAQIWDAMYKNGILSFADMTNLGKADREMLASRFTITSPVIKSRIVSSDGTVKFLLGFDGKADVEMVVIPQGRLEDARVSATKLLRNLSAGEILAQVVIAMRELGDFPLAFGKARRLTNIVFMGQGEPLLNYTNVSTAIKLLSSAMSISPWRMTVSTSGIAPLIPRLGSDLNCALAVSLHAVDDDLRDVIVPVNKQYPISELMKAVWKYIHVMPPGRHRRVTFEYVMLHEVNDFIPMAIDLSHLVRGLPAHINLIPFNPWPGSKFQSSSKERIVAFRNMLLQKKIACTIRSTRGVDVLAACGQLKSSEEVKKRVKLEVKMKTSKVLFRTAVSWKDFHRHPYNHLASLRVPSGPSMRNVQLKSHIGYRYSTLKHCTNCHVVRDEPFIVLFAARQILYQDEVGLASSSACPSEFSKEFLATRQLLREERMKKASTSPSMPLLSTLLTILLTASTTIDALPQQPSSPPSSSATATTTAAAAATTTATAFSGSLYDAIQSIPSTSSFASLLDSTTSILPAGLLSSLRSQASQPITLLAFSDTALVSLDPSIVRQLTGSPDLTGTFLSYHIIPSGVVDLRTAVQKSSSSLPPSTVQPFQNQIKFVGNSMGIETALAFRTQELPDPVSKLIFGKNQSVVFASPPILSSSGAAVDDGAFFSPTDFTVSCGNSTARIVDYRIASNGIVYIIDKVMIPPTTLLTTIREYMGLSEFGTWASLGAISQALSSLHDITVLVPTNQGARSFASTELDIIDAASEGRAAVVQFHILPGVYYAKDLIQLLSSSQTPPTLQTYLSNQNISLSLTSPLQPQTPFTSIAFTASTRTISLVKPDFPFDGGVIHLVNSFLRPSLAGLPSPLPLPTQIYPPGFPPSKDPLAIASGNGTISGRPGPNAEELENSDNNRGTDVPFGAIIGGVLGGGILVALAVGLGFVIRRRRRIVKRQRERVASAAAAAAAGSRSGNMGDVTNERSGDRAGKEAETIKLEEKSVGIDAVLEQRRQSTMSLDPTQAKRESVRNSWWSNTGVSGKPIGDPVVADAQAKREAERRSWWSGADEDSDGDALPEVPTRLSRGMSARLSAASSQVVIPSTPPPTPIASPPSSKQSRQSGTSLDPTQAKQAQAKREAERRSWWSGDDEDNGGEVLAAAQKRRSRRSSALVVGTAAKSQQGGVQKPKRKSVVFAATSVMVTPPTVDRRHPGSGIKEERFAPEEEETSALAFVTGGGVANDGDDDDVADVTVALEGELQKEEEEEEEEEFIIPDISGGVEKVLAGAGGGL